ncbi:MAG: CRISPR-associated endonuclease Cas1 [Lachnospiraceae bacterium]|jgi:CRISPR-associated protein Cas1|nr:CRISPR-associated endonuclease Cas1 [Lachnospiraceae bacterium]MCI1657029.1 CRISPR-associated endonuclease Cas1 [Lachnospiraceae bacterium]MCI2195546.1 CRISPR-associated endonuclease Cas1 [Lachnospiraceae bacterium]
MRKLLNTIYITDENIYLTLDGNNLVCKIENEIKLRIPFDNIENIVCFSYVGCSPRLMGKCVEKQVPINFISPFGKFWAKVCGETKGNVFLRVAQIDIFRRDQIGLVQNQLAAKFSNCIQNIKRTLHDNPDLRQDIEITKTINILMDGIEKVMHCSSIDRILGIEGNCAHAYFLIFNKLITNKRVPFSFEYRNKRPPLDPINAMLSFTYTLATADCASALETVGLDSYIGFYHSLKSGRVSLACDLVEELRAVVERFVISLLNLRIIGEKDFEKQISGAIWLNDTGRRKLLEKWQEKKRSTLRHPVLKENIPYGLLPYVQSNLMAKYVRGEMDEYIPFLIK